MATIINADTSDGLKLVSDTSGIISFQSAGVTKAGVNSTGLTGDGSQLTGIAGGALTLLSTLTTTSGTTQTTSSLDLTGYKNLVVYGWSVGQGTDGGSVLRWGGNGGTQIGISNGTTSTSEGAYFVLWHDLGNKNVFSSNFFRYAAESQTTLAATGVGMAGVNQTITNSTTSITFDWTGGQTFDLGNIYIYGVA